MIKVNKKDEIENQFIERIVNLFGKTKSKEKQK
jgi:hypothetical protein